MEKYQQTLTLFLNAWHDGDFEQMHKLCQLTWSHRHTVNDLHDMLGAYRPVGWVITNYTPAPTIEAVDVAFKCDVRNINAAGQTTLNLTARIVPETEPYKNDKHGTYGVNPISILKGLNSIV